MAVRRQLPNFDDWTALRTSRPDSGRTKGTRVTWGCLPPALTSRAATAVCLRVVPASSTSD